MRIDKAGAYYEAIGVNYFGTIGRETAWFCGDFLIISCLITMIASANTAAGSTARQCWITRMPDAGFEVKCIRSDRNLRNYSLRPTDLCRH